MKNAGQASDEILINLTARETRVALVEEGVLQEILIDRARKRSLVGNIYKGRVVRVLPGMDAAFVDIGLERASFLHAQDIYQPNAGSEEEAEVSGLKNITQLLRENQEIVVQITKEPLGTKGARVTTQLSIPSRYVVLLPASQSIGISVRIEDEEERIRLKNIIEQENQENALTYGYIVRTAAEGASDSALRMDIRFLQRLWDSVKQSMETSKPGSLIYADLPLELRVLRDFTTHHLQRIMVDDEGCVEKMSQFAEQFMPEAQEKIFLYRGERPVFDLHNIEEEIERSLSKKVGLKSGGYILIEQTEAMTTVDVNTGAYVGHRNLEETIFKTNLEAVQVIARQLRLRNLGGIIILDLIDMQNEMHRQAVLEALHQHLAKDHTKTMVSEVTSLGLVQMTRKRTRESLEHVLCEVCPVCEGKGSVKTAETVCYQIFREIMREARQYPQAGEFLVLASAKVVELMLDEEAQSMAELQTAIKASIRLQSEALYAVEQFDIILM